MYVDAEIVWRYPFAMGRLNAIWIAKMMFGNMRIPLVKPEYIFAF